MLLGTRTITAGDTRRYQIEYREFLQPGDTISSFVISQDGLTSSLGTSELDVSNTKLFFFLIGGAIDEAFTVSVQITTVFGEIVNDTISYQVVAP